MNRPFSPHLSIYKLDIHALMSISHRVSGIVLFLGTIGLLKFLVILAMFPWAQNLSLWFLKLWIFQAILMLYAVAVFYHSFNGLRHMLWDIGIGFDQPHVKISGFIVLGMTALSTIWLWRAIYV
jgi:succinate dehydrogenase / fumarate reductase cytochrome b subunit